MDASRKSALITGSSRGLGRHLAMAFLESGYSVVVNYLHSEKEALEIAFGKGKRALTVKADVGNPEEVAAMMAGIEKEFGGLDVVINNAAITKDSLLVRQTEGDWDAVLRTNLTGCFHIIRAAVPLMASSGGGHIINISSYSGVKGKSGQAAYSAAKAALIGLTLTAALELAEHNIRVNAVLPGYMTTEMGTRAAKAMEQAKEESILHTLSDPARVAGSIVAIAGMDFITGQVISLDSRIV